MAEADIRSGRQSITAGMAPTWPNRISTGSFPAPVGQGIRCRATESSSGVDPGTSSATTARNDSTPTGSRPTTARTSPRVMKSFSPGTM